MKKNFLIYSVLVFSFLLLGCRQKDMGVTLTDYEIQPGCEGIEIDLRIYQDMVQKVHTSVPLNQSATSARFDKDDLDFSKTVRVRAIITKIEGQCPPLAEGQIFYFPNRNGWRRLAPLPGNSYKAEFPDFGVIFFPGQILNP